VFKQRYNRNLNTSSFCRPVLLSSNFQSEHVAARELFKQRYYRKNNNLGLCMQVLLSGNVQSELVAGETVQKTILSEA